MGKVLIKVLDTPKAEQLDYYENYQIMNARSL